MRTNFKSFKVYPITENLFVVQGDGTTCGKSYFVNKLNNDVCIYEENMTSSSKYVKEAVKFSMDYPDKIFIIEGHPTSNILNKLDVVFRKLGITSFWFDKYNNEKGEIK